MFKFIPVFYRFVVLKSSISADYLPLGYHFAISFLELDACDYKQLIAQ